MPDNAVLIERGYHLIDTGTWDRRRTGEAMLELTVALHEPTQRCQPALTAVATVPGRADG